VSRIDRSEQLPRPKLAVRDLELVLALAAAGTTVKAAAALHVTQSAVSRGLLQAEQKLGARLFDRSARGLAPTEAGARLVAGASAILAQLVELEERVEEPAARPLRLRLVCECYTAYRWLPSALAALRHRIASLEVVLAIEHSHAPVEALAAGAVDVAFLTTGTAKAPLVELPLFSDEIVFVVAAAHPLARKPAITARDLTEHPVITSTQTPDAEVRWFRQRVFGRARPRVQNVRFPLTEAIVDATRAGMGIAVLSEWMAGPYLDAGDLVVKRLRGKPLDRPWRVAFRREVADGARLLAAALAHTPPRAHARAA
jgi:LysR family transcriptional regulator, regulator for metE and metH